jgi:hypothetical protein
MSSTNLKSDAWCGYNQSASPFFWVMEPGQYANTYVFGEVGVNATGGTGGSYVRPDTIDISSFLSGRDDMLSKCQPPIPDLDEVKVEKFRVQNTKNTINLLPKYTREKKSAVDLASIDYNRWQPQDIDPQDLRFIIEDMWAQRGGMDTQNFSKLAWNKSNCNLILDPARACGEYCESVSGYPGKQWVTGKPSTEPEYPFVGPYSQDIVSVGAAACGDNYFYGPRNEQGNCPVPQSKMLESVALSPQKFPLKI